MSSVEQDRSQEDFLGTSYTLVLLNYFKTICDARVDRIGSNLEKMGKSCLSGLLNHFQLADRFRLNHLDGLFRSYLDRIIGKSKGEKITNCPQHYIVSYSDHKVLTCMLDLACINKDPVTGS